jgi:hypothetical protein
MPGDLCTAPGIISLSPLSLVTDMTDATLGTCGLCGSVLTRHSYYLGEICHGQKSIQQKNIALHKQINLRNCWSCLVGILSIALYGSETWTLSKLEQEYWESIKMWCWRRMDKIKLSEKINNEDVHK